MNEIIGKTISFPEFYKMLCDMLDNRGVIKNLLVEDCTITGIPKMYRIFEYGRPIKFLWFFTIHTVNDRFCGFQLDGGRLHHNKFIAEGSDENSPVESLEDRVKEVLK